MRQEKDEGGNRLFTASPENADWKEACWCGEEPDFAARDLGSLPALTLCSLCDLGSSPTPGSEDRTFASRVCADAVRDACRMLIQSLAAQDGSLMATGLFHLPPLLMELTGGGMTCSL